MSALKRFKELKEYCRGTIKRPDWIEDDYRWAMTFHILRTYFAYCVTNEIVPSEIVPIICTDISYQWDDLRQEVTPEDYFLIWAYVSNLLEEWLDVSVGLEEFEVSKNLKNIFDFCD